MIKYTPTLTMSRHKVAEPYVAHISLPAPLLNSAGLPGITLVLM